MLLKYFGFAGEGDIIMMTTQGDTGITMQLSFALEVSQRKRIESLLCRDIPLNLSFSSIVVNRLRESFLKVISRISDYNRHKSHNTRKLCAIWRQHWTWCSLSALLAWIVMIYNRCTETSSPIETESLSRARGEGLKFILARWLHQAPALSVWKKKFWCSKKIPMISLHCPRMLIT